ncbi:hypothetical protein B842_09565 [Corynebacterium humireducens NBRC 106098 = DSM 45392]|uniref:Uncharacterized protein n=1 Tax=Corynebacterium humireducens NBRC 106098 = DSM 45392 TaxID=1223515 RepID=A0A0B5D9U0_9CORY|nr:hypothetical protein [Corynebacterium humireducens]AJE33762.1 hypothetical protein B842_09565 [Corynebacterium humireducens NBRC 106098 = DSM 45392]
MDAVTQFLLSAPLWLQIPLVMGVAVPVATVAAVALVRIVDTVSLAAERAWRASVGDH